MDLKSLYGIINNNIIILCVSFIESIQILGAYKNGIY